MPETEQPREMTDHPFDFYYAQGKQLRPAPPRADASADLWKRPCELVLSPWLDVAEQPADTELNRLFADHFWQGDEIMDAVVEAFRETGTKRGRAMLDQALAHGIDSVEDAPPALSELFRRLDNPPEWHDPDQWERGRQLWTQSSFSGKLCMAVLDFMATFVGEEVSSAVGATGRYVRDFATRNLETNLWFAAMAEPDAVQRNSPRFHDTIRVRLMHAQVRAGLRRSWGDEHFAHHGNPISNTSIMGASLSFGLFPLLFDHAHGRTHTRDELTDVTMYWAYIGYIFGAAEELVPRNIDDALAGLRYQFSTIGGPSEWTASMAATAAENIGEHGLRSRMKAAAVAPAMGMIAYFSGEPAVRALVRNTRFREIRIQPWDTVTGWFSAANVTVGRIGHRLPGAERRAARRLEKGDFFWRLVVWYTRHNSARKGVTATRYNHHNDTATTAIGCPIAQPAG
ncbi:oxygenase MpaB family protein [Nocardia higoensis]|uniref:oxygenase MpaB family protein n=1 Tax=Nocardia higoensis TaxID=228599 RepID=UPI0002DED321|nr:oxygenase MpaB family protein [Nocardia higoensis]